MEMTRIIFNLCDETSDARAYSMLGATLLCVHDCRENEKFMSLMEKIAEGNHLSGDTVDENIINEIQLESINKIPTLEDYEGDREKLLLTVSHFILGMNNMSPERLREYEFKSFELLILLARIATTTCENEITYWEQAFPRMALLKTPDVVFVDNGVIMSQSLTLDSLFGEVMRMRNDPRYVSPHPFLGPNPTEKELRIAQWLRWAKDKGMSNAAAGAHGVRLRFLPPKEEIWFGRMLATGYTKTFPLMGNLDPIELAFEPAIEGARNCDSTPEECEGECQDDLDYFSKIREFTKRQESKCFSREEAIDLISEFVDMCDSPTFKSYSLDGGSGWDKTDNVEIVQEALDGLLEQADELQKKYEGSPPKHVLDHLNSTISSVRERLETFNAIQ